MAGRRPQRIQSISHLAVDAVDDSATQRAFDATTSAVVDLQTKMRQRQAELTELNTSVTSLSAATWVSVATFGAIGNGVADDTASIQKAITNSPGKTLYFPKGKYRISSTLFITATSTHLVGDFANRNTDLGTEIVYYGTGPCIQIGVDNGLDWDIGLYNGPQDHLIENLWISHGAPDTALASVGTSDLHYKAGAYGIWDWRGGGLVTREVGIEGFEANVVLIESDFDVVHLSANLYSKYGVYIGPRSDQGEFVIRNSFFCDRSVTVDGARQVRILSGSFVFAGHATASPIEVRRGSGQVEVENAWFEHLAGYAGGDQQSLVSAGEVDGYGPGGSIQSPGGTPNTVPAVGVTVSNPLCYVQIAGNPYHTRYILSVGSCRNAILFHPEAPPNISLSNFDALVGVQATQAPSITDTQILIYGVPSSTAFADVFENLGAGAPAVTVWAHGISGTVITDDVTLAKTVKMVGNLGFFGAAVGPKLTVTGSRGGNAALASLLTALATYGLITDGSTA